MATVYVGGASIDENGKAYGGKAGNQTGKELRKQAWYLHSKGWRVFRAKSADAAAKIAWDMQAAINNRHIGYDQWERNTLYKAAQPFGFDCSKVTTDCETDCSALVRVCCAYAGITALTAEFRTVDEPTQLLKTGAFVELTGDKYTKQSAYLRAGDILCTATSGHTVVVLNDGSKAEKNVPATEAQPSAGLKKGDYGTAVTAMQKALLDWNAKYLPKYGADGDFGSETEAAVKAYQAAAGLPATGVYDEATRAKLTAVSPARKVRITGATVNIRAAPSLSARVLGYVKRGDELPWQGETRAAEGRDWHLIEYKGENGWVSGKMSEVL